MDATRNGVEVKFISVEQLVELLNVSQKWYVTGGRLAGFKSDNVNHPVTYAGFAGKLDISFDGTEKSPGKRLELYPNEIRLIGETRVEIYQTLTRYEAKSKLEGGGYRALPENGRALIIVRGDDFEVKMREREERLKREEEEYLKRELEAEERYQADAMNNELADLLSDFIDGLEIFNESVCEAVSGFAARHNTEVEKINVDAPKRSMEVCFKNTGIKLVVALGDEE